MPTLEHIVLMINSAGAHAEQYVPKRDWSDGSNQATGIAVRVGSTRIILLQPRRDLGFQDDSGLDDRLRTMGRKFALEDTKAQAVAPKTIQGSPRR